MELYYPRGSNLHINLTSQFVYFVELSLCAKAGCSCSAVYSAVLHGTFLPQKSNGEYIM